ncbi:hypothetical protein BABINDRAFT_159760 [Babjeviella inositovora NRRL Y-12698]|uniref:Uncharacterized protein n=1 Tax=Babjeviella inositovora NRRL Y-12698 TaxID=984486 RepID=A0A1E3QUZ4_9ASCO|nr:uncharacterized protein BABINDRAFT_159760 [Babjeviella inositovora NRRL Y-12698]ODQ81480.1 hypothetical protein BABINDRAFT_159760 [Babjeviella inositovora NRRL Y-12698]
MSGSIVRALGWGVGIEQQYIAVNPAGDEIAVYQTNHSGQAVPATPSDDDDDDGIVKVYARGGFEHIQCATFSHKPGILAAGQSDGTISVFDIRVADASLAHLRPKQQRPVNSLSFNQAGLLAVGFDKSRHDYGLQVWDVEHYSSSSNNSHINKPAYTYISNEAVLSTCFITGEPTNLLCGSYKFLREMDLRSDVPVFQLATRNTLGITMDPFVPYHFASYAEDGTLCIWDRRNMGSVVKRVQSVSGPLGPITSDVPALTFSKLLADTRTNHRSCFRYSSVRKGEFSTCFNGEIVRRWQTGVVPEREESKGMETHGENGIKGPKEERPNIERDTKEIETALSDLDLSDSLFVTFVLDVKTVYERVISFDYIPDLVSATKCHLVCMRQSGSVYKMSVLESPESIRFNSFNEFTVSGPDGVFTHFAMEAPKPEPEEYDLDEESDDDKSSFKPSALTNFLRYEEVLLQDICAVMRARAMVGYSTVPVTNVLLMELGVLAAGNWAMRNSWKWLMLAQRAADKGKMQAEGLDLGYEGVLGIWSGVAGMGNQQRYQRGSVGENIFVKATQSLVASRSGKRLPTIPSYGNREAQRKLCLYVAGWDIDRAELDEKLTKLIGLGMYEKAAGLAVFHGDVAEAVHILLSSKKERLRIISTAVAGYHAYKGTPENSPWKDQCRRMASELDDPYLRAIFAFIADNDWWDVLDESSLPLRERLGVALRFLSDKDLTIYLNRLADKVISHGNIEGLVLTGITPKGIDLLQSYVDRTSDVQTASLIAAFGCPKYFQDVRVDHWIDSYCTLLNSWSLFHVRAKFNVARAKLARDEGGRTRAKVVPRQLHLQCIRCNKNISKPALVRAGTGLKPKARDPNKGCPHCGAPLPRCAICLLSLGMPIPLDVTLRVNPRQEPAERAFKEWFSFCLACNHGMHAGHAEEWFAKHYVCPVADCSCKCNSK